MPSTLTSRIEAEIHPSTERPAFALGTRSCYGRVMKLAAAVIYLLCQPQLFGNGHDRHLVHAGRTPGEQYQRAEYRALIAVLHALIRMLVETRLYDGADRRLLSRRDRIRQAGSAGVVDAGGGGRPDLVRLAPGDQAAL